MIYKPEKQPTLYLSDLDGTLLRSNERISEYAANTIDLLVKNGGFFSYATARSLTTASKVTERLTVRLPVICYNGAFIFENLTNKTLYEHFFTSSEVKYVRNTLCAHNIYPIVYSFIDGAEQLSYIERYATIEMKRFFDSRTGDPRLRKVKNIKELYSGDVFYFDAMDTPEALANINEIFKDDKRFNCLYQKDIYSGDQWWELLPAESTKANAALSLKDMLGCSRLVVFGDGINDLSMFSVADECYAVSNAVPELKAIATAVIDSNDNDGVAKWLEAEAINSNYDAMH